MTASKLSDPCSQFDKNKTLVLKATKFCSLDNKHQRAEDKNGNELKSSEENNNDKFN